MRWSTIRRLLPPLTVLATLAIPVGAAAAPPPAQLPPQIRQMAARSDARITNRPAVNSSFALKTRDGYEVEVFGLGEAGTAFVSITRNGGKSSTGYAARGTVSSSRLAASFGKFGNVAMRFQPAASRPWNKPDRVCQGSGRFVNRTGTFVGSFRFRGEGGYVSVAVKRAKGHVVSVAAQCERAQRAGRKQLSFEPSQNGTWGPEVPYVGSRWRSGVSGAEFLAVGGRVGLIYAGSEETLGSVALFHYALLKKAPAKNVKVSNSLTSARVSPPPPFSGSATYRAAPDGKRTWTGSLTVNFPGAEHYSLTDPPFKASIGFAPAFDFLF